ncbi:MAG TPA: hypothetical protein VNK03_04135 [Gammaproteobacteria bacterium]|nr:hypothetical protein [Gammaproteobacteria bacterium]
MASKINYFCLKPLIFIFGFLVFDLALAGVYRCVDENGAVEFRDRGCEIASQVDDFLPYVYKPTDPNIVFEKEEAMHNTQKAKQKQNLEQKKKVRLETRQKKAAEKATAKAERRLMRCEKNSEKIKQIESELRAGCKIRRCNTLKKQLIHAQKMQKHYCTPP